jgi:hypothetical protein
MWEKLGKNKRTPQKVFQAFSGHVHIFSWHPSAQEDLVSACFGMFRHSILSKEAEKLEL